jgi:ketosteroid isomerase-like protein
MKTLILKIFLILTIVFVSVMGCARQSGKSQTELKDEIVKTEKEFAEAAKNLGIQEAFYSFSDENAVIRRGNDSLISGRENIRNFYQNPRFNKIKLDWKPDYTAVSEDGSLGWTYGKYSVTSVDSAGLPVVNSGIFHTVWKKQKDGSWKFVWD